VVKEILAQVPGEAGVARFARELLGRDGQAFEAIGAHGVVVHDMRCGVSARLLEID